MVWRAEGELADLVDDGLATAQNHADMERLRDASGVATATAERLAAELSALARTRVPAVALVVAAQAPPASGHDGAVDGQWAALVRDGLVVERSLQRDYTDVVLLQAGRANTYSARLRADGRRCVLKELPGGDDKRLFYNEVCVRALQRVTRAGDGACVCRGRRGVLGACVGTCVWPCVRARDLVATAVCVMSYA